MHMGIFLLLGACLIPFTVLHHPPLWFYCLVLGFLLPGLLAATASDGIEIDARTEKITRWWKVLGMRIERSRSLAEFNGIEVRERAAVGTQHGGMRYDVVVTGSLKDMTVYTVDLCSVAEAERDSIVAVCPRLDRERGH